MPTYLVKKNKNGAGIMVWRKNTKYPSGLLEKREKQGYKKVTATNKLSAIEKVVGVKFKRK